MLEHLSIKNYILIRELNIEFDTGFTAITGETGAGKSILIGALSLILGKRADTDVLLNKDGKCVIEGNFSIEKDQFKSFFEQNELDLDDHVVLRREINKSGKSRAFVNDTPVTLPLMKELGTRLVDIHSQHETLLLNESGFQLTVLDNFAGNKDELQSYRKNYEQFTQLDAELNRLKTQKARIQSEEDFIRFQYEELDKAMIKEDELKTLEEDQEVLAHSEEIKSMLYESLQILQQSEDSLLDRMSSIVTQMGKVSDYHKDIKELNERLLSAEIELKDIASTLSGLEDSITYDPARLEELSQRLDLLYGLLQKHKVQDTASLLRLKDEFQEKLGEIDHIDDDIDRLQQEVEEMKALLEKSASKLREKRIASLPGLENEITAILNQLGMEKAGIKVNIDELDFFTEVGKDQVEIMFTANPGSPLAPVSRIASGGEMSRIMLALKSMITRKNLLPTVILDEIDMGVSGEIAARVGALLKEMSDHMQLIAITHLPQIAGKAGQHFKVYKEFNNDQTETHVKRLSNEGRVEEIAAMMSNETISTAAKETARELLQKK